MAILGCGEADSCRQVAVAPGRYASMAECSAATPGEVERHVGLDYSVIVAQCVRAGTRASFTLDPAEIELPEAPQQQRLQPAPRQAAMPKGAARG